MSLRTSSTHGEPLPTAAARPRPRWPLPLSIAILVGGGILVVLETPSLLFFLGLFLIAVGIYGIARRPGAGRPHASPAGIP